MNEKKFFIAPLDRLRDLFGGKRTTALCLDSEKKKRFPSDFRLLVFQCLGVFLFYRCPPGCPPRSQ